MADERLRELERRVGGSGGGVWEDVVALERARDRLGVGPGLVGEELLDGAVVCAPVVAAGTGAGSGDGGVGAAGVASASTVWSGVLRPGLWRVGMVLPPGEDEEGDGDFREADWILEGVGSPARALLARAFREGALGILLRRSGWEVGERVLRAMVEEMRDRRGSGEGSGGVIDAGVGWRVWSVVLGLEEVPGGLAAGRGVFSGTGVLPAGVIRLARWEPASWVVRVDGDVAVRARILCVGGLEGRDDGSLDGSGGAGSARGSEEAVVLRRRLTSVGRAPRTDEISATQEPEVPLRPTMPLPPEMFGMPAGGGPRVPSSGTARIDARRLMRFLGGTGRGSSSLRGTEGMDCEPGVGEV